MDSLDLTDCLNNCPRNDTDLTSFAVSESSLHYSRENFTKIIGSTLTIAILLAALIGNSAVIIVSIWDDNIRSQTGNILILFLACIDVLTSIFVMLPSAFSVVLDYWPLGDELCRIHAALNYMFACCSAYGSAMISLDRAIAILYPFQYKSMVTTKRMLSLVTWISIQGSGLAVVCLVTPFVGYDYFEAVCAIQYTTEAGKILMQCGCSFCYYIPVTIVTVCNILILFQARKSSKEMSKKVFSVRHNFRNEASKLKNSQDLKKSIHSMVAIVCVYYICYTPYAVLKQVKIVIDTDTPPLINYLTTIFIYISSATNPFIYGILRKDYRNAFKKLFRLILDTINGIVDNCI